MTRSLRAGLFSLIFLGCWEIRSEPWISNRFSQNCASCHAPGRQNLPVMDRRCTLSCQGCHVNPNGGGLRNSYGLWNETRWLKSFSSPLFSGKDRPAPLPRQKYYDKDENIGNAGNAGNAGKKPDEIDRLKIAKKLSTTRSKKWVPEEITRREIYELVTTKELNISEDSYDRSDGNEHTVNNDRADFLVRVPKDDPYRLERAAPTLAGGGFRYLFLSNLAQAALQKKNRAFPMAFDLGVRLRPTREHLSFVAEARFLNGPVSTSDRGDLEQQFTSEARVRAAYALVDDLPYNSYAMFGLYRPLFGHLTPDHTSLAQILSGFDQRSVYKAFTIGSAPNVPFVNFHLIQHSAEKNFSPYDGFAINLGGRWVTLGASAMVSYWKTTQRLNRSEREMIDFTLGGAYGRLIANLDFLRVQNQTANGKIDAGNTYTVELKQRFWREMYLVQNFEMANVAEVPEVQGSALRTSLGFKSYFIAGTQLETLYIDQKVRPTGAATRSERAIQAQVYLYF